MTKSILKYLKNAQKAYTEGNPIISDEVFDELASKYNFYEIGATPGTNRGRHFFNLYSLQKIFQGEKEPPYYNKKCTTPKLDGAAISLLYVYGKLISGFTRGDGTVGENITDKVLAMGSIPNVIDNVEAITQVTGEVVANKNIKNPRNYASGSLHLKDLEIFKIRDVIFVAYGVQPYLTDTYTDDMYQLGLLEFNTVTQCNWDEYPQDGLVVRCDNNNKFEELGYTAKHPKGAYALKKRSDVAVVESELRDVVWQLGKGGKVTPVAIFDAVIIEGAKITRATLHNVGFIENKDLHIGDTLLISRAGGVIPKIVGKL